MHLIEHIKMGHALDYIVKEQRHVAQYSETYLTPDSLKYLQINKRIGAFTAIIGNFVQLKPFIGVKNGIMAPEGQAFGRRRAIEGMANLAERFYNKHG